MRNFKWTRSPIQDPRSSCGADGGFTLLELVVVLVLMGLAFALVLPGFGGSLRHWRLQAGVREVAATLKFARNQSVAGHAPVQVILDRSRNVYWLDRPGDPARYDPEQAVERGVRLFALPKGVRFGEVSTAGFDPGAERVGLEFFPKGTSTGGEVQIRGEDGRVYRISLDPVTGRTHVFR